VVSNDIDNHDPKAYFEETYKVLIEYLADPEKSKVDIDLGEFDQDKADFPFTVNLRNPYYDPYKGSYYFPKCRNCGD
jgi:hypothetical protein